MLFRSESRVPDFGIGVEVPATRCISFLKPVNQQKTTPHRIVVKTKGGRMWIAREMTLSSEWKTSEFRHVAMAVPRDPRARP